MSSWPQLRPAGPTSQSGCSRANVVSAPTRKGASQMPTRRAVARTVSIKAGSDPNFSASISPSPSPGLHPSSIWTTSTAKSCRSKARRFSATSSAVTSPK